MGIKRPHKVSLSLGKLFPGWTQSFIWGQRPSGALLTAYWMTDRSFLETEGRSAYAGKP